MRFTSDKQRKAMFWSFRNNLCNCFSKTVDILKEKEDPFVAKSYVLEKLDLYNENNLKNLVLNMKPAIEGTNALKRADVIKLIETKESLVDLRQGRDPDELSEDYVSKGDSFSRSCFSKRNGNITKTDEGYECDYCGEDFDTKVSAKVHASMCDDKDSDDGNDDFFNGDDGDLIT